MAQRPSAALIGGTPLSKLRHIPRLVSMQRRDSQQLLHDRVYESREAVIIHNRLHATFEYEVIIL